MKMQEENIYCINDGKNTTAKECKYTQKSGILCSMKHKSDVCEPVVVMINLNKATPEKKEKLRSFVESNIQDVNNPKKKLTGEELAKLIKFVNGNKDFLMISKNE